MRTPSQAELDAQQKKYLKGTVFFLQRLSVPGNIRIMVSTAAVFTHLPPSCTPGSRGKSRKPSLRIQLGSLKPQLQDAQGGVYWLKMFPVWEGGTQGRNTPLVYQTCIRPFRCLAPVILQNPAMILLPPLPQWRSCGGSENVGSLSKIKQYTNYFSRIVIGNDSPSLSTGEYIPNPSGCLESKLIPAPYELFALLHTWIY